MGVCLGCRILVSFQVGILMTFDSAPESIKNLFQGLLVENLHFLNFLRERELSNFFLLVFFLVYSGKCDLY